VKSASGLSRFGPRVDAGTRRTRDVAAMTSPLSRTLLVLLALNAIGYAVALATNLVDPVPGFLNGSRTHAPLVIWGAQTLGVVLLLRGRRGGGWLALLACTVSLTAVAFDGDLASAGLGAGHIALQVAIGVTTVVLWAMVARWLAASSPSSSSSVRWSAPRAPRRSS
jgi:hypothetical protein